MFEHISSDLLYLSLRRSKLKQEIPNIYIFNVYNKNDLFHTKSKIELLKIDEYIPNKIHDCSTG